MTEDKQEIIDWLKEHLDISLYRVEDELIAELRADGEVLSVSYLRDIQFKEEYNE